MGLITRLAERRIRHLLARGDRIVAYDVGRDRAMVYVTHRAVYLDHDGGLRRWEFPTIASVGADAACLDLAGWNGDELVSTVVDDLAKARVVAPIRDSLLALPRCSRSRTIGDEEWTFTYHPWRPGAAARMVFAAASGVAPITEREMEFYDRCLVELLTAPGAPGPEWTVTPVPETLSGDDLVRHWSEIIPEIQVATLSNEPRTVLGLDDEVLWIVDLETGQHPRIDTVPLEQVTAGRDGTVAAGDRAWRADDGFLARLRPSQPP
ncbi:hypothetical protein [Amycolatopsis suaedae]|uniref:Uncharacterized protein n=1 Tax=Amycolatopsis suaedae TaxID=2510978 RepID=A0A4Q7JBR1_9PSEU|nr:hypothetical protein [Amycolatopsis suaedae]RZQ65271.1 hypothetical protein EWH70_05140 [Amycolatopsis suaedae]